MGENHDFQWWAWLLGPMRPRGNSDFDPFPDDG